jgi:hypothetical protein
MSRISNLSLASSVSRNTGFWKSTGIWETKSKYLSSQLIMTIVKPIFESIELGHITSGIPL